VESGDKFYIQSHYFVKNQAKIGHRGGMVLNNRGEFAMIVEICQNELTNHTLATALVHTDSVLVSRQRLDGFFLSAAATRAALN